MSDENIANTLGRILGRLDSLDTRVRDYIESHDARHMTIDTKIDMHAEAINQAKGAKTAIVMLVTIASTAVGWALAKLSNYLP